MHYLYHLNSINIKYLRILYLVILTFCFLFLARNTSFYKHTQKKKKTKSQYKISNTKHRKPAKQYSANQQKFSSKTTQITRQNQKEILSSIKSLKFEKKKERKNNFLYYTLPFCFFRSCIMYYIVVKFYGCKIINKFRNGPTELGLT